MCGAKLSWWFKTTILIGSQTCGCATLSKFHSHSVSWWLTTHTKCGFHYINRFFSVSRRFPSCYQERYCHEGTTRKYRFAELYIYCQDNVMLWKRFPHHWAYRSGIPYKWSVLWSFDAFYVFSFNDLLNKHLICRWFWDATAPWYAVAQYI